MILLQSMCIYLGFLFLTTLNIYKNYFKGRHKVDETWCKGFFQAYCDQRQFVVVHISLDEATAFVHYRVL